MPWLGTVLVWLPCLASRLPRQSTPAV